MSFMNGFRQEQFTNPKQILFMTNPYAAVGVVATDTGVTANEEGRKIIKAGTPLVGSLEARNTAFKAVTLTDDDTTGDESSVVGVAIHDIDVTDGDMNAELLIFGFVNLNNLDNDVQLLINAAVKTALNGKVYFLK